VPLSLAGVSFKAASAVMRSTATLSGSVGNAFVITVGRRRQDCPLRGIREVFQDLVGAVRLCGRGPGQQVHEEGRDSLVVFTTEPTVKLISEVVRPGEHHRECVAGQVPVHRVPAVEQGRQ
jgi:hypothetical protein